MLVCVGACARVLLELVVWCLSFLIPVRMCYFMIVVLQQFISSLLMVHQEVDSHTIQTPIVVMLLFFFFEDHPHLVTVVRIKLHFFLGFFICLLLLLMQCIIELNNY